MSCQHIQHAGKSARKRQWCLSNLKTRSQTSKTKSISLQRRLCTMLRFDRWSSWSGCLFDLFQWWVCWRSKPQSATLSKQQSSSGPQYKTNTKTSPSRRTSKEADKSGNWSRDWTRQIWYTSSSEMSGLRYRRHWQEFASAEWRCRWCPESSYIRISARNTGMAAGTWTMRTHTMSRATASQTNCFSRSGSLFSMWTEWESMAVSGMWQSWMWKTTNGRSCRK